MNTTAIVMKKGNTSYVEMESAKILVNGVSPQACPGNCRWSMYDGEIETLEAIKPARTKLAGFRIKEELRGVVSNVAEELPADALSRDYDSGGWSGEHAELYEPFYEEIPQSSVPIEFEVIDFDCEPVEMPEYVVVDFPANLRFRHQVQHKYPCHIDMKNVYNLVAEAIVREVGLHKELYKLTDHRNIQCLSLDVVIAKKPHTERRRDLWSRRPRWTKVTVSSVNRNVFRLVGTYHDKSNAEQVVSVCGNDYADLQKNLDAYIRKFLDRIDPRSWCVCEKCNGEGVVLAANNG